MIERQFVSQKFKEHQVEEFLAERLSGVGFSHAKVQRTPLGEKIVVFASRPGLVVGREGQNIRNLTLQLKEKFGFENPTIEIAEVDRQSLDPQIMVEKIVSSLERFGINKFKAVMHKTMEEIMNSGSLGCEILVSGKVPSARAKSWRVYSGYMKKCGDLAVSGVKKAHGQALLKSGVVGIKVSIMPPDIKLPDAVEAEIKKMLQSGTGISNVEEVKTEAKAEEKKEEAVKEKKPKKKTAKKEVAEEKAEEKTEEVADEQAE